MQHIIHVAAFLSLWINPEHTVSNRLLSRPLPGAVVIVSPLQGSGGGEGKVSLQDKTNHEGAVQFALKEGEFSITAWSEQLIEIANKLDPVRERAKGTEPRIIITYSIFDRWGTRTVGPVVGDFDGDGRSCVTIPAEGGTLKVQLSVDHAVRVSARNRARRSNC